MFEDLARKQRRPAKRRDGTLPEAPVPVAPAPITLVRVRILSRIVSPKSGFFAPGQAVMLPSELAQEWVKEGLAEFDKMLDGPPETKS